MNRPRQHSRRSFLNYLAYGMGGIAIGASGLVMIDSMNPAADALRDITQVDLSKIKIGERKLVAWRGLPIYIHHRTQEDIAKIRAENWRYLRDPQSDKTRVQEGHDEWFVVVGVCTNHGCMVRKASDSYAGDEWGGWFCPCCGARYDMSGRARSYPALKNMRVPPYSFEADSMLWIGKVQFPT